MPLPSETTRSDVGIFVAKLEEELWANHLFAANQIGIYKLFFLICVLFKLSKLKSLKM